MNLEKESVILVCLLLNGKGEDLDEGIVGLLSQEGSHEVAQPEQSVSGSCSTQDFCDIQMYSSREAGLMMAAENNLRSALSGLIVRILIKGALLQIWFVRSRLIKTLLG